MNPPPEVRPTRLADGRIASVYAVGRPAAKWGDTSIPQKVFGRFSKDGRSWSEPELLLTLPSGPVCSIRTPLRWVRETVRSTISRC